MGGRRRLIYKRTAASSLLTLVAVAVPTGAWWVGGSRHLEREAALKEETVTTHAFKKAVMQAERLATRLEVLRDAESRRAFYHYQNLFHDPRGAYEGASVIVSPLAEGAADPLIDAHFQVDEDGRLTLPTLNDDFPELSHKSTHQRQCALLSELAELAVFCSGDLVQGAQVAYRPRVAGNGQGERTNGFASEPQVEVMDRLAWEQHLRANALYGDLKYRQGQGRSSVELPATSNGTAGRRVSVTVGPFLWHTLPVAGRPSLVALRSVETPVGLWTQGFVVAAAAVAEYLKDAPYPAAFVPVDRARRGPTTVTVTVGGTPWAIVADISEALAGIGADVDRERVRFRRMWLSSTFAAGLAGLLVLGLVFQSERLAAQRAQFAASAAHELRTPLAGLRLYAEMLAEGLGDLSRSKDYARRLASEAERLGRVVSNVLGFTRFERRSLAVHPELGDLGTAVREAVERHEAALRDAGVELGIEIPGDLPRARFDRDAVCHIVQNLLDNAEKYTRGLGTDRRIGIEVATAPGRIVLAVTDNGLGIPNPLRRRLFRPFSRGEHPDAAEGLGLGLVLVKALAEAQGAEVSYADAPGGGAIFRVAFAR